MRKVARYVYVGTSWVLLAWVLITIFVAGMALFIRSPYWDLHRSVGWGSDLPILLLILAGLLGWIPRRLTAWLVGVIVLHTLHISLPALKGSLPFGAAVHPLSASLLAWLCLTHARRARQILLEAQEPHASEPRRTAAAETG